jgi:glycine/D-amino acid oxidase-like deaminating enzyme
VVKVANHGQGLAADPSGERQVPASEEDRFRSFLRQALPGLAEAPVARTRLCFYCDTFDGDFFIGRDHQHENLVVCAGDSGHAFKFAPLLGSITADVVEGRPNRWKDHFAWRHPAVEMGAAPRK